MAERSAREILAAKLEHFRREHAISSDPAQRFALEQQIEQTERELAALGASTPASPLRVDLTHLPAGAEHFLGRGPELAALDRAWASNGATAIVECIAPGGTGKTALAKRWLDAQRAADPPWGGAERVLGWTFYSQGSGAQRNASEDLFLAHAIERFGVDIDAAANPADKGSALAEALMARRTLLVLDGLEPLQHPPGQLAGELRAPGLKALLTQLAAAGHPGLCLLTSREWLTDLKEWVRPPDGSGADAAIESEIEPTGPLRGSVLRIDLGSLNEADGAALLHARGAVRAGAAAIAPAQARLDPELRAASRALGGHALTLSLLGRFIARAKGGDIRRRGEIDLVRADQDARGHAGRMVAAYVHWFQQAGRHREVAALHLLGLFDRPAAPALLDALRQAPPIAGLTEPLQDLDTDTWTITLANLADAGLIERRDANGAPAPDAATEPDTGTDLIATIDPAATQVDAHPLIREHLGATLRERAPDAWCEGHRRLYEWLKTNTPYRPDGLPGLQPLYQAVAHGCLAGEWHEALADILDDRILRGTESGSSYSTHTLGAISADLAAAACFFDEPWVRPARPLSAPEQAWLLHEVGFRLRALGRLAEALEPMRTAAEMRVFEQNWTEAGISYGNLSELELALGQIQEAVTDARRSVEVGDRSDNCHLPVKQRPRLADALHQQGANAEARAAFAEAEAMQAERQPQYPLLYSFMGFRYCDLLLSDAERAAWSAAAQETANGGGYRSAFAAGLVAVCTEVARRAAQTLEWGEQNQAPLLTIGLDHLTLARCAL
ncbi:hypothetical protein CKO31_24795 [Thiohalocapsa halophila]|uniref:ATP-binding protein n=1 Tax=Thiohalocapsa halophila TaxID=69359 RepID=A0ABS1CPN6_9GAMM|nr:tetratricopeptide repeat protein [Thiohalocapsa halophila]MBK1633891.1 hypothetical protein [Thiohalocapsa halophila]